MRAGEVARRAGVNVETLRYYERRGLLPEPTRAPGGYRRYDEEAVRFVRAIKEVQAAGFTLAEIEEYLRAVRRGRMAAPEKPIAAFRAAQDLEAAPFLGDTWFYRTLAVLGAGESRLIETLAGEPLPSASPLGDAHVFGALSLKLTRAGERVLQQKADRMKLLGVDRWVGGTHITAGTAWRWDPAAQLLAEPT